MPRRLLIAAGFSLLGLLTIAVVWAGRNWPPPLWILEYGLPGAQGPTGRVARVEDVTFVEVRAGYALCATVWLDAWEVRSALPQRWLRVLMPDPLPSGYPVALSPSGWQWCESPRTVWIHDYPHDPDLIARVARTSGLPIRGTTESGWWHAVHRLLTSDEAYAHPLSERRLFLSLSSPELLVPFFVLPPGGESLLEPYLVKTDSPGAGLLRPVRDRRKLAAMRALT